MDWSDAEPVLKATYDLLDDQERVSQEQVCQALDRPIGHDRTIQALAFLYEDDFIGGFTVDQSPAPVLIQSTPKGRQRVRGWPGPNSQSDDLDRLLTLLDQKIEAPGTPEEEKTRLLKAREAFANLSRDVAVGVLTALVSKQSGLD